MDSMVSTIRVYVGFILLTMFLPFYPYIEVVIRRAGLGWVGLKLTRFFWTKILTAQSALKTGPIGPNSIFKTKKNSGRPGRVGLYRAGPNLARFFSGK